MPDDDNDSHKSSGSDIVIGVLYAVGIGINVYLIADQLSDGALTRCVSTNYVNLKGKVRYWYEERKAFRKDFSQVLWQATETVEEKASE